MGIERAKKDVDRKKGSAVLYDDYLAANQTRFRDNDGGKATQYPGARGAVEAKNQEN